MRNVGPRIGIPTESAPGALHLPGRPPPNILSSAQLTVLELIIQKVSYLGFIVFLALTGVGLPIPEEAPLVLAGVLSANGTLEYPWLAYLSCLIGALLGDTIMYAIGRRLGHGYLRSHPRFAKLVNPEQEEKFEHIVNAHGFKALLLTRFLIGVRGPVYFAAGAARVPYLRFLMWDLCAATMVVSVVFGLSYRYGEQISGWIRNAEYALTGVVAIVVLGVGLFVYRRYKGRLTAALDRLGDDAEDVESDPTQAAIAQDETTSKGGAQDDTVPDSSAPKQAASKPPAGEPTSADANPNDSKTPEELSA